MPFLIIELIEFTRVYRWREMKSVGGNYICLTFVVNEFNNVHLSKNIICLSSFSIYFYAQHFPLYIRSRWIKENKIREIENICVSKNIDMEILDYEDIFNESEDEYLSSDSESEISDN